MRFYIYVLMNINILFTLQYKFIESKIKQDLPHLGFKELHVSVEGSIGGR